MQQEVHKNLKYNYIANLLDGGAFGFGLGFASFTTILPLFVSSMTNSAILIGLIPAIHSMGWQFPQLLIARRITGAARHKPMTLYMTVHERLPYLGLALVAWFLPGMNKNVALIITFLLLIWQGLGAGITANSWQNLICRVIPGDIRATFFGLQSSAANLMASVGALLAGYTLDRVSSSKGFAACFAAAVVFFILSWFFLAMTREPAWPNDDLLVNNSGDFWKNINTILKRDRNFRWYLVARMLTQFATTASAFYMVYTVRYHGMTELTAGVMTSVLLVTQTIANPTLGWLADHWSRKSVLMLGAFAMGLSALLAFFAPSLIWFYLVFILAGIGNTASWTISMALTLEFGTEADRPSYVGMANTLIAPATILAPFIGGLLADLAGYGSAFIFSACAALLTGLILVRFVRDPEKQYDE